MKIYEGIEEFSRLPRAVVTSGTFDGVHVGHQKILATLTQLARSTGGETVVITFWPHPRMVLHADSRDLKLLSTLRKRQPCLNSSGSTTWSRLPLPKNFRS